MWRKALKASRRHSLDPLAEASSEKSCGSEKSVSERSLLSGLFQPPKAQLALQQALQRAQQAQQAQKRAASATSTAAGSSNGELAGLAAVLEGSGDDIGLPPPPPPPPPPAPRLLAVRSSSFEGARNMHRVMMEDHWSSLCLGSERASRADPSWRASRASRPDPAWRGALSSSSSGSPHAGASGASGRASPAGGAPRFIRQSSAGSDANCGAPLGGGAGGGAGGSSGACGGGEQGAVGGAAATTPWSWQRGGSEGVLVLSRTATNAAVRAAPASRATTQATAAAGAAGAAGGPEGGGANGVRGGAGRGKMRRPQSYREDDGCAERVSMRLSRASSAGSVREEGGELSAEEAEQMIVTLKEEAVRAAPHTRLASAPCIIMRCTPWAPRLRAGPPAPRGAADAPQAQGSSRRRDGQAAAGQAATGAA